MTAEASTTRRKPRTNSPHAPGLTAAQIAAKAEADNAAKVAERPHLQSAPSSNAMFAQPMFCDVPDEELRERLARCRRAGFGSAVKSLERELLYRARKAAGLATGGRKR